MPKILDVDRHSGIVETFEQDKMTGKIAVKKIQNVDKILAANKAELNAKSEGWQGDWHKVASIPLIVVEQWREELKAAGALCIDPLNKKNKTWLIAKLNSRDYSQLRTKSGRI